MFHTFVVIIHVVGACGALVTGFLALNIPNGTSMHRRLGKLYLLGWVMLASSGVIIGWRQPGISVFEVLNVLGLGTVCVAYSAVLFRKRIGQSWMRRHYSWMLNSLAFLVIATINQVLPRLHITYPWWIFLLMVVSPSLIIPLYIRRLDRRYGYAKQTGVSTAIPHASQ